MNAAAKLFVRIHSNYLTEIKKYVHLKTSDQEIKVDQEGSAMCGLKTGIFVMVI